MASRFGLWNTPIRLPRIECLRYDIKQPDGETLEDLGNSEYPLFAIALRSTLA